MAALGDEDVGGFYIPVNYPFGVGRVQPLCDLNAQIEDGFQLHRTATDAVLQRHAVHKFHGNERPSVFLTDFVDGADVRMVQC